LGFTNRHCKKIVKEEEILNYFGKNEPLRRIVRQHAVPTATQRQISWNYPEPKLDKNVKQLRVKNTTWGRQHTKDTVETLLPTHKTLPPTHKTSPPTHETLPPTHETLPPTHETLPPTHETLPPTQSEEIVEMLTAQDELPGSDNIVSLPPEIYELPKPARILMICTEKLPVPPVRGGAIQTYIAGVAPILSQHHHITILGITDPDLPTEQKIGNVNYVRVPGKLLETYMEGVVAYLSQNSFDLIHIFNRPRLVTPVRKVAPHSRIVLSMHNDMFIPEKIHPTEAEMALEQVDHIVTVSDYVGRTIANLYPQASDKLRTIYSGVDLKRYIPDTPDTARKEREALRREYNLDSKQVILFVGRLSPKKGADILVRAMNELAEKHKDVALVLVGSKWYSDEEITDYVAYVRALAARSSIPIVTTGFVPADQVHKWFWAGDIFVCPSQWEEPLARVHYEAMAAELPIVTTARGGNPEIIPSSENGLIITQPENPQAFAEALSTLLSNPKLMKQMGAKNRKLAMERYGWDRVARDILQTWEAKVTIRKQAN
jgi:spore coat protein SA